MAREVTDPDGITWCIRRRWAAIDIDKPEIRTYGLVSAWDFLIDLGLFGIAFAVLCLVAVAVLIVVILPLILLAVEVVGFLALLVAGVGGRVLLGRPWRLEADADAPGPDTRFTWRVAGWRTSQEAIDEIAAGLRNGRRPPPASLVLPAAERR